MEESFHEAFRGLLYKRGEYFYPGTVWHSTEVLLQFDQLFKYIEDQSGISERQIVDRYYTDIMDVVQHKINSIEQTDDNFSANWIQATATPKYVLLYILEHIEVKLQSCNYLNKH